MMSTRRLLYIGDLLAVFLGSFFVALWLLEDERDTLSGSTDTRSDSERLASEQMKDYSELRRAARKAGLKLSLNMVGTIDRYSCVNERDVAISGWLADPEGDANPLKIIVFVAGSVAVTTRTNGERADVTRAQGLAFGAEKNVAFGVNFACLTGQQPIVVGLGIKRQYFPLPLPPCP
jgi:hypothetical protein